MRGTRNISRIAGAAIAALAGLHLVAAPPAAPPAGASDASDASAAVAGDAGATALSARLEGRWGAATVEIAATAPTGFRVFTLVDPLRLVVDFPGLSWPADVAPSRGGLFAGDGGGLVTALRVGGFGPDRSRLVLDLARPAAAVEAAFGADGGAAAFRLRLEPVDAAAFAAAAGWPSDAASTPRPPERRRHRAARAEGEVLIVIDPGHGGVDPGALADGVREKDLVLDYARALKARIDARAGFRAVLTRDEDRFLTLRDRVAFARAVEGDAFLSLHADALESGAAAGASVYTLSAAASDDEAAALSTAQNRAEEIAGVRLDREEEDVARALVDLSRRRTDDRSAALGAALAAALRRESEVLEGRALRTAGFRVLKAPDVPSALVEIGFLSSARDLTRLRSPEGRADLTRILAEAVFAWAKDDALLAARRESRETGDTR